MGAEWKRTAKDRLLSKAQRADNGCLVWTGHRNRDGYGRMGYQGAKSISVHRVAYIEFVGEIPEGMQVDHLCHTNDNDCPGGVCQHRACIEPTHLELVSAGENTLRGRSFAVANRSKKTCPQGHEYDDKNTIRYRKRRFCRTCTYQRTAAYKARKRASA